MTDEEKKSLELHRLKQWVETVNGYWAELQEMRRMANEMTLKMGHIGDNVAMALLEIKDQKRRLLELGLTEKQVDSIAKTPDLPFNVTSILKRVDGV
jgi:hypothetical protein